MSFAAPAAFSPILDFYLGPLDPLGRADADHSRRWFTKDEAFDREITERFGDSYDEVRARRHEDWLADPRGGLAYVIVLDQFPRNMFRGSPRAFESDAQALAVALDAVTRGHDRALGLDERALLYMPFMHSEELTTQNRGVALFSALAADAPAEARERYAANVKYAEQHREIVAHFGRFPQRNSPLSRTSRPDEIDFLKKPGSGF
jgi:uncharacterized protein (DUF924 family)